jgi:Fe-S cluster assembly ATPase SufC
MPRCQGKRIVIISRAEYGLLLAWQRPADVRR